MTQIGGTKVRPALILASASPRRRELISKLGVPFRVVVADIDEQVLPRQSPHDLTMRLSQTKALTIAGRLLDGADDPMADDPVRPGSRHRRRIGWRHPEQAVGCGRGAQDAPAPARAHPPGLHRPCRGGRRNHWLVQRRRDARQDASLLTTR